MGVSPLSANSVRIHSSLSSRLWRCYTLLGYEVYHYGLASVHFQVHLSNSDFISSSVMMLWEILSKAWLMYGQTTYIAPFTCHVHHIIVKCYHLTVSVHCTQRPLRKLSPRMTTKCADLEAMKMREIKELWHSYEIQGGTNMYETATSVLLTA